MKINKKSPQHWIALLSFAFIVIAALILRKFVKKKAHPTVLLYGHKFNGNLKAFYDYSKAQQPSQLDVYFLTMDKAYADQLKTNRVTIATTGHYKTALLIAKSACIISDHGLHCLQIALHLSNIKFIDVWHGIPFKGFDASDFKTQHKYDQIWVSSQSLAEIYCKNFNFKKEQIKATGYGRSDLILDPPENRHEVLKKLNIAQNKKIILYAPTWKQESPDRSLFPFDLSKEIFYSIMSKICIEHNAILLVRSHLNTQDIGHTNTPHIHFTPHSTYSDTESLLISSDILICDWSSICFDFLPLKRPTIFLDVPPPFPKGFTLTPSFRFGCVVSSKSQLAERLEMYLISPDSYNNHYKNKIRDVSNFVYGESLDGESCSRYSHELQNLIGSHNLADNPN